MSKEGFFSHLPVERRDGEDAETYVENGITRLILVFSGADYDLSFLQELIAWRDSRNGG